MKKYFIWFMIAIFIANVTIYALAKDLGAVLGWFNALMWYTFPRKVGDIA